MGRASAQRSGGGGGDAKETAGKVVGGPDGADRADGGPGPGGAPPRDGGSGPSGAGGGRSGAQTGRQVGESFGQAHDAATGALERQMGGEEE